jgi:hypothetical protein
VSDEDDQAEEKRKRRRSADVARRDDDDRGDSDQPPTRQDIESWYQRQDDAQRTDTSATLAPLANASAQDWLGSNQDPDVLLSVPNLGIDHIGIEVDNLKAHVELHAKVLDLLELDIGADVSIEKVDIQIDNVRLQAMLKVRLDRVADIIDRVMDTIDRNPEILTNLTAGLGKGLEAGLGKEHAAEIEEGEGRLKGVEGTKSQGKNTETKDDDDS